MDGNILSTINFCKASQPASFGAIRYGYAIPSGGGIRAAVRLCSQLLFDAVLPFAPEALLTAEESEARQRAYERKRATWRAFIGYNPQNGDYPANSPINYALVVILGIMA